MTGVRPKGKVLLTLDTVMVPDELLEDSLYGELLEAEDPGFYGSVKRSFVSRRSLKASGSRPSLDCEWRSMFDFNLVKIAAEQIKSGRSLKQALDAAEAHRIYLSEEWIHPSLP